MAIFNNIIILIIAVLAVLGLILLFVSKSVHSLIGPSALLVLKRPHLWIIGAFAGMAAYGGEVNFIVQKTYNISDFRDYVIAIRSVVVEGQANELVSLLKRGFTASPALMIGYIVLLILVVLVVYWIILMSQGIVMRYVGQSALRQPISILDAIGTASKKFWEIVKISVIFLLIGWGAWLVVVGLPTVVYFLSNSLAWTYVAQVGWYLSLIVSVVCLFVVQFAITGALLFNQPAVAGIVKAWNIFRHNVMAIIELALVLFVINFLTLWLILAVLAVYAFPSSMPNLVIDLVVLFLELGLTAAFSYAATTSLYVRLQNESPDSKLGQWTEKIVNLASVKKTV